MFKAILMFFSLVVQLNFAAAESMIRSNPVMVKVSDAPTSSLGPPLSFDDSRFSSTVTSSRLSVSKNGVLNDKSIVEMSGEPTIFCQGTCTLKRIRVSSRESLRIVEGVIRVEDSWLEATGSADDHADVIQAYSPGSAGSLILRNTSIVSHNTAANAGVFIADNWKPNLVDFENVVIWGGPYGIKLHTDGYTQAHLRMKNVCFVGPFMFGRMLINSGSGGASSDWHIDEWTNVNDCTVVGGKLVVGNPIPAP